MIFQEKFGNGEPTDEMFEAICAAVKPEAVYAEYRGNDPGNWPAGKRWYERNK